MAFLYLLSHLHKIWAAPKKKYKEWQNNSWCWDINVCECMEEFSFTDQKVICFWICGKQKGYYTYIYVIMWENNVNSSYQIP